MSNQHYRLPNALLELTSERTLSWDQMIFSTAGGVMLSIDWVLMSGLGLYLGEPIGTAVRHNYEWRVAIIFIILLWSVWSPLFQSTAMTLHEKHYSMWLVYYALLEYTDLQLTDYRTYSCSLTLSLSLSLSRPVSLESIKSSGYVLGDYIITQKLTMSDSISSNKDIDIQESWLNWS